MPPRLAPACDGASLEPDCSTLGLSFPQTLPRQELGLDILEVSASSERTGPQLLRMVGEATQSRRLAHMVMEQQQAQSLRGQVGERGGERFLATTTGRRDGDLRVEGVRV